MSSAEPISAFRRTSSASIRSATTALRHPTPDLQIRGALTRNITRLEKSAEEMSAGGSDIGEEIRRMNEEQKERSLSRENSIQSSHQGEINVIKGGALARMGSEESRSRAGSGSIVNVNGAARWGGYSPGGYISSPVGSVRSGGSWSQRGSNRKTSASGSSRLAQMVEPMQEGRPLDSPLAPSQGSLHSNENEGQTMWRRPSQSSFGRQYDQIASQIKDALAAVPPSPPRHEVLLYQEPAQHAQERHELRPSTPPDRPRSADTFQEAQIAFKDFDGVHFLPETEEFVELDEHGNEVRRVSARTTSGGFSLEAASMLCVPRTARPMSYAEPPPTDGMVYYPAPVPRMLNLPKRLSQLPSASVQARQRPQGLSQLPQEAQQSAPWIPHIQVGSDSDSQRHRSQGSNSIRSGSGRDSEQHPRGMLNERMSMANLNNLPPHLRASIYFNHQPLGQDVEVKSESAVATLDSILAASATAPVSAFTDHPFAGDVRRSVFAPEQIAPRRSAAPLATQARNARSSPEIEEKNKKRRSSSIAKLLRRNSSGNDLAGKLSRNGSRHSLMTDFNLATGNKLQKRKNQLSLSTRDELDVQAARTSGNEISELDFADGGLIPESQKYSPLEEIEGTRELVASRTRPVTAISARQDLDEGEQIEDDFRDEQVQEDVEDQEPVYAAPSTLLAELQIRKAYQKKRGKTAATAFPQGMHSTLLELDAVEQIKKEKRKKHKIALAWEEQNHDDDEQDEDEDVPLGMLFPTKNGLSSRVVGDGKDWDRPLGLVEKRQLEDSEPLSSRRNRMLGLPPSHGREPIPGKRTTTIPNMSELHLAGQPDAALEGKEEDQVEDETEGETLAQRLRRLKTKDALDTAISDFAPKEGSRPVSTFTNDVLSQFGGLDVVEKEGNGRGKKAENRDSRDTKSASVGAEEEETLGQRRARLQREREASAEQPNMSDGSAAPERPAIRTTNSTANLLDAHPVGILQSSKSYEPSQGTLLHASAKHQAKQKAHILSTNVRSSSYGLDGPLVDARSRSNREPSSGGLLSQQQPGMAHSGGFAYGMYNNGLGGVSPLHPQTTASSPGFSMNGQYGYFASPTAMSPGFGNGTGMMGHPQTYQPARGNQLYNPMAYQALTGGPQITPYGFSPMAGYGYGAPQMPYPGLMQMGPMGVGLEEPLDPKQRAAIDQWRMSVGQ